MYPVNNTIMVPYARGLAVIDISSIMRIEAISNYSKLFLTDGRQIVISKVLKQMERMLSDKGFIRTHRSHLVNTACVQVYNLRRLKIILSNKEEVAISRRKRRDIRKKFYEQKTGYLNQNSPKAA